MPFTLADRNELLKLVVLMFDAAPGATYLNDLAGVYMASGNSVLAVANVLDDLKLYTDLHGSSKTNEEFTAEFLAPLGLRDDAFATSFVMNKLAAGASKGEIAYEALQALNGVTDDMAPQFVAARDILQNKLTVSAHYSVTAGVKSTDFNMLQAALHGVTNDDATVTAAIAEVDAGTRGASGNTSTSTTGQDTTVGTGVADVIRATFGGTGATFTAGDNIDGGAGNDQLALVATGTTPAAAIVVKNVESITIQDTVGASFDQLLVENDDSLQLTFTNTVQGRTSMVTHADGGTVYGLSGGGNLGVAFANTTGTADLAKVSVSTAGTSVAARSAIDVSNADTVESVSLQTTGTNFLNLASGTAARTVTITGDGTNDIVLTNAAATITLDASASTGTNTFDAGNTVSTGDAYKGGSGKDTLSFKSTTAIGSVAFTGIETLKAEVDVDAVLNLKASSGIQALVLSGNDGALSVTNAPAELDTINVTSVGTAGKDIVLTRAQDAAGPLTLNLGSTATDAGNITLGDLAFDSLSALTINAVGTKDNAFADIVVSDSDEVALTLSAGTDGDISGARVTVEDGSIGDISLSAGDGASVVIGAITAEDGAIGDVTIGAAADAFADLHNVMAFDSVGNLTLTAAEGAEIYAAVGAKGTAGDSKRAGEGADVGDVHMDVASGASGHAYVTAYSGSVGDITSVVGEEGFSELKVLAYAYSAGDGTGSAGAAYAGGGCVGAISLTVDGDDAHGIIEATTSHDWSGASGADIGAITLDVNGDAAIGSITAVADAGGDVGDIVLTQEGSGFAKVFVVANEDASADAGGNIGDVSVTLGESGSAYVVLDAADAVGAIAVEGGDGVEFSAYASGTSGGVGAIDVTLGDDASAYVSASAQEDDATVGPITVAVGQDSDVVIHATSESEAGIGAIDVTAGSGTDVEVHVGGSGHTGDFGDITVRGGAAGDLVAVRIDSEGAGTVDLSAWAGRYTIFASGIPTGGLDAKVAASGGTGHFSDEADIVSGGAGADWLYASGGADVVAGGDGKDFIDGGIAADVLDGGAGDDTLAGGEGADAITGGAGTDTASYAEASAGVGVDLGTGAGTVGEAVGDTLAGIEAVVGSSHADTLAGGANADGLNGGAGADTLQGGAGADNLAGGADADVFVFSDVDADVDTSAAGATDTIADFETVDTLDFDTAGSEANYAEAGESAASLGALLTAADAALNGTVTYYFGAVGSDGYLVFDADGTGITSVVKLTGVDAAEISAANIS